ncbi:MAG: S4 domain-containing protein [Casimicrobiaceae bacterium]|nr:S4 domain-containing protein [Casimicrobiaceae bacterium]MDW8311631.1 S4 domain-containing protein [Burkholderiales bacterium]
MSRSRSPQRPAEPEPIRLDKWLWAARFFKTRALAVEAIEAGHVRRVTDPDAPPERVKPSLAVRVGMRLIIQRGHEQRTIDVLALTDRRGPAQAAATLYTETAESVAAREAERLARAAAAAAMPRFSGRPTKQDRRRLAEFFARHYRGHPEDAA